MDYFSNTGVNAASTASTTPNKHDFDELNLIYAHTDSSTTVAAMMALAVNAHANSVSEDPISWGALMRQSADGRSSVYEQYHHDGSKSVTHVYWTDEAAASCRNCDHRTYR